MSKGAVVAWLPAFARMTGGDPEFERRGQIQRAAASAEFFGAGVEGDGGLGRTPVDSVHDPL